ncbi:MAG TPA: hypothetical protein VJN18_03510 [Polyangiaceae bacterium]|nr:hypothetical protein [Polyangiaceae bacterium]
MRRKPSLLMSALVALGCGGKATEQRPSAAGGASGAGGVSGTSGVSGSTAAAGSSFVPENRNVSDAGDGRLEGGGFDRPQGEGWDTCSTTTPGLVRFVDPPESFLRFDSTRSCEESFCSMTGGALQVAFFLRPALAAGEQQHLYFDVINFADSAPRGALHFGVMAFEPICSVHEELATIPLSELEMASDWQTRCVTFTANAPFPAFGLYVTGESFLVGLDTFRFGPACHIR